MREMCKNNHEMTKENTYICPKGYVYCRKCRRVAHEKNDLQRRGTISLGRSAHDILKGLGK